MNNIINPQREISKNLFYKVRCISLLFVLWVVDIPLMPRQRIEGNLRPVSLPALSGSSCPGPAAKQRTSPPSCVPTNNHR